MTVTIMTKRHKEKELKNREKREEKEQGREREEGRGREGEEGRGRKEEGEGESKEVYNLKSKLGQKSMQADMSGCRRLHSSARSLFVAAAGPGAYKKKGGGELKGKNAH